MVSSPSKIVLSHTTASVNMKPMSKRAYSLMLMIVGLGIAFSTQTSSQQWIERTGCFLFGISFMTFLSDMKERREKKQP